MRAHSFFFAASALAASVTLGGFSEIPGPSQSQLESSFNQFLREAAGENSEIRFGIFTKHSCKLSPAVPGHICSFTFFADKPAERLPILPAQGRITGRFFAGEDGKLKFEMMTG
jgi:hypothetical protein